MELFPILMLFVGIFFLVWLVSKSQGRSSRLNHAYMRLGQRFGGSCKVGGMFSFPVTTFRYGGSLVAVRPEPNRKRRESFVTVLSTDWPDSRLRLEVADDELPAYARRLMGMQDIEVGDERFDRDYRITCSDPSAARTMLHSGVRLAIRRLRGMGPRGFELSIRRGGLHIRLTEPLSDASLLEDFVRWSLLIRDQMQLSRAEGITFLDSSAGEAAQEIVCQVCGDDIREDIVYCRRCQTPHHRDCWYYFGACSTYGCREDRFTVKDGEPPVASSRKRHPR